MKVCHKIKSYHRGLLSSFLCLRQLLCIPFSSPCGTLEEPTLSDLYIVLVNPLHHVNSTVMSLWALWEGQILDSVVGKSNKPTYSTQLHLIEKYVLRELLEDIASLDILVHTGTL